MKSMLLLRLSISLIVLACGSAPALGSEASSPPKPRPAGATSTLATWTSRAWSREPRTGTIGRATPTSAQTNRLNGAGTIYDAVGNLTHWNGAVYQYDAFNQMIHMTSGNEDWVYLYTADDERVWSYNVPKNTSRWALKDLGGKVLREYQNDGGAFNKTLCLGKGTDRFRRPLRSH